MSIFPVKLSEWFPLGDEKHEIATSICSVERCYACGGKIKFHRAYAHHSLPWGFGDIWCSEKCIKSRKKARIDRRRTNRLFRKIKKSGDSLQKSFEVVL